MLVMSLFENGDPCEVEPIGRCIVWTPGVDTFSLKIYTIEARISIKLIFHFRIQNFSQSHLLSRSAVLCTHQEEVLRSSRWKWGHTGYTDTVYRVHTDTGSRWTAIVGQAPGQRVHTRTFWNIMIKELFIFQWAKCHWLLLRQHLVADILPV